MQQNTINLERYVLSCNLQFCHGMVVTALDTPEHVLQPGRRRSPFKYLPSLSRKYPKQPSAGCAPYRNPARARIDKIDRVNDVVDDG